MNGGRSTPPPAGTTPTTSAACPPGHGGDADAAIASDHRLASQSWTQGIFIGAAQILALFPSISRSGATMAAGLWRGLSHEDAARFAFLLATPVIAGAGLLKLPQLAGPPGHGILGQVLAGSLVAGIAAYLSLRFLTRYFETRTPFAIYCLIAGTLALAWTALTWSVVLNMVKLKLTIGLALTSMMTCARVSRKRRSLRAWLLSGSCSVPDSAG
jgi:undecaprenyl-diphosphatase